MTGFEQYVEAYSRDLMRFCYKLCGNQHDAEDLFQDTWTKALTNFSRYQSDRSFKNWLFAICANTFRDTEKEKYRTSKALFQNDEEKERFLSSIPTRNEDIDLSLDLYDALHSLPKKHRLVITLYYFKEFSQKEIAEILSIPEGTVASRLNTAKKRLKRRLSNESNHG